MRAIAVNPVVAIGHRAMRPLLVVQEIHSPPQALARKVAAVFMVGLAEDNVLQATYTRGPVELSLLHRLETNSVLAEELLGHRAVDGVQTGETGAVVAEDDFELPHGRVQQHPLELRPLVLVPGPALALLVIALDNPVSPVLLHHSNLRLLLLDAGLLVVRRHAEISRRIDQLRRLVVFSHVAVSSHRSEERRVGKECRSRWSP